MFNSAPKIASWVRLPRGDRNPVNGYVELKAARDPEMRFVMINGQTLLRGSERVPD